MLVIVGHGPSGCRWSVSDTDRVVRLKAGRPGFRADVVYSNTPVEFDGEQWTLRPDPFPHMRPGNWARWSAYFAQFNPTYKPSTGLRAVFCAVEFEQPNEIGLIGFDRLLHPDIPTTKWWQEPGKYQFPHDAHAEHAALMGLGVCITEV